MESMILKAVVACWVCTILGMSDDELTGGIAAVLADAEG